MLKILDNVIHKNQIKTFLNWALWFALAFMILKVMESCLLQCTPETIKTFNTLITDEHGKYILSAIFAFNLFVAVLFIIAYKLCKLVYSIWINIKATIIDEVDGVEEEHAISVYKIKSR